MKKKDSADSGLWRWYASCLLMMYWKCISRRQYGMKQCCTRLSVLWFIFSSLLIFQVFWIISQKCRRVVFIHSTPHLKFASVNFSNLCAPLGVCLSWLNCKPDYNVWSRFDAFLGKVTGNFDHGNKERTCGCSVKVWQKFVVMLYNKYDPIFSHIAKAKAYIYCAQTFLPKFWLR